MKKVFKEGQKSKCVCYRCKQKVNTTFHIRSMSGSKSNNFKVLNLLVGVCDECDSTVSIPQQSVDQINQSKKVYKKLKAEIR